MNQIVVTLLSAKPCELNRFLYQFYDHKMNVEEGAFRWSSIQTSTLECSLLLATLMDNLEDFQIEAYISIQHKQNIQVSKENITGIIKYLYLLDSKSAF